MYFVYPYANDYVKTVRGCFREILVFATETPTLSIENALLTPINSLTLPTAANREPPVQYFASVC